MKLRFVFLPARAQARIVTERLVAAIEPGESIDHGFSSESQLLDRKIKHGAAGRLLEQQR
jgi:hypothetical protein